MTTRERTTGGCSAWRSQLSLLGAFSLVLDGRPTDLPTSSQRVAAFVALQRQPVGRALVAGSLWPSKDEERASANLRCALWRLNRNAPGVIQSEGSRLAIAKHVSVDIYEFEDWAARLAGGTACSEDWERRMPRSLELLTDWYDDWIVLERERVRQQFLHALEDWADGLTRQGRYARAIQGALMAVAADPLRESAHRAVIVAHIAEGNGSEALRHYKRYRDILDTELGVSPSPRMEALIDPLNRRRPEHLSALRPAAPV
jgi:DNA-binding SARP family transcriptional activator